MQPGIFAKTFAATSPLGALMAAREAGYEVVQFNMALLGGPPMPATIDPADCAQIAAASRQTGVSIAAVSGTYNMIHPDPAVRAEGLSRLATLLAAAPRMGTRLVTLCTGTRHPTDQWAHHPDNAGAAAWHDLLTEMAKAAALAETEGVDLGIEPELGNVVATPERARALIDVLGSARVKIVLDPANLFERASVAEARSIVDRAIDALSDRIVMAHAKDRDVSGNIVTAGSGIIDFAHFVSRLRGVGFDGPLVTHGLSEAEAPAVAAFLRHLLGAEPAR